MKSVKPGRGPSWMSGFSSIAVAVVGVFWTIGANAMGAPGLFTAFGVVFILMALGGGIYNFYNATAKKRLSAFDVTDETEEPDPLNERAAAGVFCPYCGEKAQADYRYCGKCGRELPAAKDE